MTGATLSPRHLGGAAAIYELQRSLCFGNTDALCSALDPYLESARHTKDELRAMQAG